MKPPTRNDMYYMHHGRVGSPVASLLEIWSPDISYTSAYIETHYTSFNFTERRTKQHFSTKPRKWAIYNEFFLSIKVSMDITILDIQFCGHVI
jgi:hypothetical protein